jgi:hypothetical protein
MRRTRQNSLVAKKRKQDASSYSSAHNGVLTEGPGLINKASLRASTFPHVRSKSVDRKNASLGNVSVPGPDTIGYPNANTTNFYDLLHPNTTDGVDTPPLTAGLSHAHDSFPVSPIMAQEQNFPLADISAVMFPSADPVEYPNQNATTGQSYEDILKSLANDPSFPFPTTLNELRMQRAAGSSTFVPPSSTFMFSNGDGNDQNQIYDNDIQLIGPMPAYMMQGSPFTGQQGSSNNSGNDTVNTPTDFTAQFLNQQGNHILSTGQSSVANMNLDQLLGGEEWEGLNQNPGYAATIPQMFASQASGANAFQRQTSQPTSSTGTNLNSARTSADLNDRSQFNTKNVSFDDLNPGVLDWNLGGY